MFDKIASNFKKNKKLYFFLFLFVVALFYRLDKSTHILVLEADEGRDLLVARHIIRYRQFPLMGHDAAGIAGLRYGPYYYYLLSIINLLYDSPYFAFFFITIWHSLSAILLFFIGKNFEDENVGAIAALFYIYSSVIIFTNNIWGAYVAFQLLILSLFFFSLYFKNNKKYYLYLHIIFLIFSIATEYSNVIYLPGFVIWHFIRSTKSEENNNKYKYFIKAVVIYLIPLFITFLPHFIFFRLGKITTMLKSFLVLKTHSSFFESIGLNLHNLFSSLFTQPVLASFYLFSLFLALIILIIRKKRSIKRSLFFVLSMFLSGLMFSGVATESVYVYHLLGLYLFLFLTIGILIKNLAKDRVIIIMLCVPIFILTSHINYQHVLNGAGGQIEKIEKVSEKIGEKIVESDIIDNFEIIQNSNTNQYNFFPAPEFYLFLENKLDRKLVDIVSDTQFNVKNPTEEDNIFLICRKYTEGQTNFKKCFSNFLYNFDSYVLKEVIYDSNFAKVYYFSNI